MPKTFAEHILRLASPALSVGAAQSSRSPRSRPESAAATTKTCRPAATYASVVLAMAIGTGSPGVEAATDGDIARSGNASSARLGISLSIPERIEARGLGEVVWSGDVAEASGCILGHGSGLYGISVIQGTEIQLSYTSKGTSTAVLGGGRSSDAGAPKFEREVDRLKGAGAEGCGDVGSNAQLRISKAQSAKTYGEALTLLISPE